MINFKQISLLTLQPKDETEQQLFWAFKLKSIKRSIRFYIVLNTITALFLLLKFLFTRTLLDFVGIIGSIVYTAFFFLMLWVS